MTKMETEMVKEYWDGKRTDKEMTKYYMTKAGFEVSEIGSTLQWTVASGKTMINWFDKDGNKVKSELR